MFIQEFMSQQDLVIDTQTQPTLDAIRAQHSKLAPFVFSTPIQDRDALADLTGTAINFKFELLQASGTFKARGAFSNLLALSPAQRAAGVTCVSAGNHAVAVAYAAMKLGISAKVVMIKTASPFRVALCRQYGAEVVMADNGAVAFEQVRHIEQTEGRFFVHPFNGYHTVLGTATLGFEWATQARALDAVILPIGGGGLAAGVATAFKLVQPDCKVYGVEPEGADSMAQSFNTGGPIKMGAMQGIADSLMAPHTEAYSLNLCRQNIDELTTVSDDQIRQAMVVLFEELKLAPEPACAVATAALLGPLRAKLKGKRVGVLLCGTNTDLGTLTKHLDAAKAVAP
jgi:threonine dehydratase